MNNYNKLLNNLETLKLLKIKEKLDEYIDLINSKQKNMLVFTAQKKENSQIFLFYVDKTIKM